MFWAGGVIHTPLVFFPLPSLINHNYYVKRSHFSIPSAAFFVSGPSISLSFLLGIPVRLKSIRSVILLNPTLSPPVLLLLRLLFPSPSASPSGLGRHTGRRWQPCAFAACGNSAPDPRYLGPLDIIRNITWNWSAESVCVCVGTFFSWTLCVAVASRLSSDTSGFGFCRVRAC